jgi:antitoxin VapB
MGLNIKNERVCALAKRVAAESGQTQTAAIESALERYLEMLLADTEEAQRAARVAAKKARIDAFLATLPPPDPNAPSGEEIMAQMYDDELGLPR